MCAKTPSKDDGAPETGREFVGEEIEPLAEALEAPAAPGEPGLPRRFRWRGRECTISQVLRKWHDTGACRHGSGERYVRRHWFLVLTDDGAEVELYFERQRRRGSIRRQWRIYTLCRKPQRGR